MLKNLTVALVMVVLVGVVGYMLTLAGILPPAQLTATYVIIAAVAAGAIVATTMPESVKMPAKCLAAVEKSAKYNSRE